MSLLPCAYLDNSRTLLCGDVNLRFERKDNFSKQFLQMNTIIASIIMLVAMLLLLGLGISQCPMYTWARLQISSHRYVQFI